MWSRVKKAQWSFHLLTVSRLSRSERLYIFSVFILNDLQTFKMWECPSLTLVHWLAGRLIFRPDEYSMSFFTSRSLLGGPTYFYGMESDNLIFKWSVECQGWWAITSLQFSLIQVWQTDSYDFRYLARWFLAGSYGCLLLTDTRNREKSEQAGSQWSCSHNFEPSLRKLVIMTESDGKAGDLWNSYWTAQMYL